MLLHDHHGPRPDHQAQQRRRNPRSGPRYVQRIFSQPAIGADIELPSCRHLAIETGGCREGRRIRPQGSGLSSHRLCMVSCELRSVTGGLGPKDGMRSFGRSPWKNPFSGVTFKSASWCPSRRVDHFACGPTLGPPSYQGIDSAAVIILDFHAHRTHIGDTAMRNRSGKASVGPAFLVRRSSYVSPDTVLKR